MRRSISWLLYFVCLWAVALAFISVAAALADAHYGDAFDLSVFVAGTATGGVSFMFMWLADPYLRRKLKLNEEERG